MEIRLAPCAARSRAVSPLDPPEATKATPKIAKSASLWSESQTTCGKTDTREESAVPAPRATGNAGIAQQTRVLDVANKVATELHKLPRV